MLTYPSGSGGLIIGMCLPPLPYLEYARSEGSGEPAHMHRLTRAFAARCWLSTNRLAIVRESCEQSSGFWTEDLTDLFLSQTNSTKQSKKEGKGQESIQSSTTPDLGYQWESDNVTTQELEVRSFNHPYSLKTKSSQCHYVVTLWNFRF